MQITGPHREVFSHAPIKLHAPAQAMSIFKRTSCHIHEFPGTVNDCLTIRSESRNDAGGKVRSIQADRNIDQFVIALVEALRFEISIRERTPIIKNADAAANGRAIIVERQIKQREARGNVPLPGDIIAIDPQAALESYARVYNPTILNKTTQL